MKTHTGWHYKRLNDGSYLWTAPTGHQYRLAPASRRDRPPALEPDRSLLDPPVVAAVPHVARLHVPVVANRLWPRPSLGAWNETPSIHEWIGGTEAIRRWLDAFYDEVERDALLAPVFGGVVTKQHREHVTAWWAEVMGGPAVYTEEHGGYEHMLAKHRGLDITPEQRLRFVTLLSQAADAAGHPGRPGGARRADGVRRVGQPARRGELGAPSAAAGASTHRSRAGDGAWPRRTSRDEVSP